MKLDNKKQVEAEAVRGQEWQEEAWSYFDDVPELKYSTWFQGNLMAKARLFVGVRDLEDPDKPPVPITDDSVKGQIPPDVIERAQAELHRLKGPLGGKSEIIRELNMNLEIAAEAYLVGFGARTVKNPDGVDVVEPEAWDIKSISEVILQGGVYKVRDTPDDKKPREIDKATDTIIRIWQRHPRFSKLADNTMRGALSECEAVVLLSNTVKAIAKSQMNGGILLIPNELGDDDDVDASDEERSAEESTGEKLNAEIYRGLTDPIEDPSSAASVNPTVIRGPIEALHPDVFRLITLARPNDATLDQRIEARVQRIARGTNLPVEVVMGHQGTTFANAEQVDEDTYTKHFEPRLILVSDALTVGYLQPNLLDSVPATASGPAQAPVDQAIVDRLCVWFDPSALLKPVDPVESADKGVELGLVKGESWRRVKGWTEDDAPDPIERLLSLVLHLRAFDPGVSTAILTLLDVPLDIPEALPGTGTGGSVGGDGKTPPGDKAQASVWQTDAVIRAAYAAAQARGDETAAELLLSALGRGLDLALPVRSALGAGKVKRNPGYRLMTIDRELRARLVAAADVAVTAALKRAGNRLRSKAKVPNATLSGVDALHVGATLGAGVVRASGVSDEELIGADAYDELERQFLAWGAQAQGAAVDIVNDVVGISSSDRIALQLRQSTGLAESWTWLRDQLHELAVQKIYNPDPHAPDVGEFDPTSKVPTGLIRQALARAGGANGLTEIGTNPYVALNNDDPLGGIGTGQDIMGALSDGGALVEAYEWVYGDAYRAHPFEDHEALDGEVFADFQSDVLAAGDWVGPYYFPGDHDGCVCDIAPAIVAPEDLNDF